MERARHGTRLAKKALTAFAADDRRMTSLDGLLTCSLDILVGSTTRVARPREPSFRPQRAVLTVSMPFCPMVVNARARAVRSYLSSRRAPQLDKEHGCTPPLLVLRFSFVVPLLKLSRTRDARHGSPILASACSERAIAIAGATLSGAVRRSLPGDVTGK